MKRPFEVVFSEGAELGYVPGDQVAHRAAAALADRCDAPTLDRFAAVITLLETIGGQVHITALRQENQNGRYETIGFGFQYESVDARIREAKSPSAVEVGAVTIAVSEGTNRPGVTPLTVPETLVAVPLRGTPCVLSTS